jgi:hypothetical protein
MPIPKAIARLVCLLFLAPVAWSQTTTAEGLVYTINGGAVTITGYTGTATVVTIPADIGGLPVTRIGIWAFKEKTTLTGITFPSSITTIEAYAFYGCSNLANLTLPSGLQVLDSSSFAFCSALTSVTIPASVITIGRGPFTGCLALTDLTVAAGNANYASTSDGAFILSKDGLNLVQCAPGRSGSITVPATVTHLSSNAFDNCRKLTEILLPAGLKVIEGNVFSSCVGIKSLALPEGLTSIGGYAFINCIALASINLPSTLTSLGEAAFQYCYAIRSIVIPGGVTEINPWTFYLSGLTNITLPSTLTRIGGHAFRTCNNLKSITIPAGVTTLGDTVFGDCANLTTVAFLGDAPTIGAPPFSATGVTTVYYAGGKSGWTSTFSGLPTAVLTVPAIAQPPVFQVAAVGKPVAFTVSVTASPPPDYQWRKGGVAISGATNASYSITAVQLTDAGSYDVVVSNVAGSATSAAATLTVGNPPVIATQPVSQSVPLTSVVGFTVSATGTAPLTYQWRKNGANFNGAVTASHVMNNLQTGDAGSYDVVVSNAFGTATSSAATLTLTPAVWFNAHPVSQTIYAGTNVTLTSAAAGYNTTVTYQWRKNGTAIAGATTASLTLTAVQPAGAGSYDVVATSTAASATSNAAVLTVSAVGPTITAQPQGTTLAVGGSTTLAVTAVGGMPMTYQWRKNGLDLAGVTQASLPLTNAQTYQAGDYSVVVTNAYGAVISAVATVNVVPRVVSWSARLMVDAAGAVATFVVEGTPSKKLLLRAVGPGLAPFGLPGMADPRLELFDRTGTLLSVNDDWTNSADYSALVSTTAAVGAFALTHGSKDAAIVRTLTPGAYAVRVSPAAGAGGLAYLELYDADLATGPISTVPYVAVRGRIASGPGVVIGGLGANGRGVRSYLIRAIGPSLGIAGTALNPSLLVVRDGVFVGQNDDWDANAIEAAATLAAGTRVAAFPLPAGTRDAAAALTGNLHAGAATVQVGSGDVVGGTVLLELHDVDAARPAAFAPILASPPVATAATLGSPASLRALAHGTAPLSYQWIKDGAPVAGATRASLEIPAASLSDGGSYAVAVSNALGTAQSFTVPLTVTAEPALGGGVHALTGTSGYRPGTTLTLTNTLSFPDTTTGLGWAVSLPAGWSFAADAGAGEVRPLAGDTGMLEWAWTTVPVSPVTFTYSVNVPAGASGDQLIAADAIIRSGGTVSRVPVSPHPLVVVPVLHHSADSDGNFRLSLLELTRVIELYNTRHGLSRSGCYDVASQPTEDGFDLAPARVPAVAASLSRHHSADSNRDGKISLLELTRVIELYNFRSGSSRTGQYKVKSGTEDGFDPGP